MLKAPATAQPPTTKQSVQTMMDKDDGSKNVELVEEDGGGLEKEQEKKKDETKKDWRGFRYCVDMAKREAPLLAIGSFSLLVAAGVTMYMPLGFGRLIDLVTESQNLDSLRQVSMQLAGALLIGSCATFGRVVSFRLAGERLITRLRHRVFKGLMNQHMTYFDRHSTGDMITRLSVDTAIVAKTVTGDQLSTGLRSVAQACFGLGFMLHLSPQLSGVMVLMMPVLGAAGVFYGRYVKKLSRQVQDAHSLSNQVAQERLGNMRTVRAFSCEEEEQKLYGERVVDVFQIARKAVFASASFFALAGLIGSGGMLGVLYAGGHLIVDGALTPGILTSFLMYSVYLGMSLVNLASFYGEVMKAVGATGRLTDLLRSSEKHAPVAVPKERIPDVFVPHISFENVTFCYPTRPEVLVLRDFSLEVRPGHVVAVVGASGTGKSTIWPLLLRFYDVSAGRVCVNGEDVRGLDKAWLRRNVAIVGQEPVLFSGTIADNIRYGCRDADRQAMETAARDANAHDFIMAFPRGYDTEVGEGGTSLSGGQKQRIAIARAILKDSPLLFLDEATSALDGRSQKVVQDALARLMRQRTTIIVAHRLSTVAAADEVCVLHAGRVVERGEPAKLLADPSSRFAKLTAKAEKDLDQPSAIPKEEPETSEP